MFKNYTAVGTVMLLLFQFNAEAQTIKDEIKYRRSSLHTMLIESDDFPKKDQVMNAYSSTPFPDKYDNHDIGVKFLNTAKYSRQSEVDSSEAKMPEIISLYFTENKTANQLVAKWFNRKSDGTFDDNLVMQRGLINASFLETKTAAASAEGRALLANAGYELINNTFVVVNKMKFIENEPVARVARDLAIKATENIKMPLLRSKAIDLANKGYEKAKEGYSVWTTSYLYQLKWDKESETAFNETMLLQNGVEDAQAATKKALFDTTDLFKLEYIGAEKARSLVTFSLSEKRTEEQIINLAVVRNVENVYAKLQKKYDVFKTKVPLYSGSPLTAKIGLKEGLEAGDKFEVLEQVIDPKTGIAEYKKKGVIKVDKKMIWDNRYSDGIVTDDQNLDSASNVTTFDGGKDYQAGMLIRQIK